MPESNRIELPIELLLALADGSWQNGKYELFVRKVMKANHIDESLDIFFYDHELILQKSKSFHQIMINKKFLIDSLVINYSRKPVENSIAPELTMIIADFGLGSDQPIVLDYRRDLSDPEVLMLVWGDKIHWKMISTSFSNLIKGKV